jgi:hypothetical protein
MALRAVLDHPKFARLKKLTSLSRCPTLGYLEGLWHFTARYTPQGNIGKYRDTDIEAWLEWEGADGALIAAFADAGWLDRSDQHRLAVHDWSQYADEVVHTELARKCLLFTDGVLPHTRRLNQAERERYNEWLKQEGYEKRVAGRPVQPESEMQTKCRDNADGLHCGCAKPTINAAETTKPVPVPVPEPVPEPVPVPEPEGKNKQLPFSAPPPGEPAPPGDEEHLAPQAGVKKPQRSADERRLVRQVFDFYVQKVGLDPARCHLTRARAEKAYTRLDYCMKLAKDDPQKALHLMCEAVAGLVANDWLMGRDPKTDGKRWIDFNENVFRSDEQMEKRWEDYRRKAMAS